MNYQFTSAIGGMNSDVSGSLIRADQYRKGVNISSRGGSPRTRPFLTEIEASLPSGIFQGSRIFSLDGADRIVMAIDGHIYTWNLSTDVLTQVTDAATRMSETEEIFHFLQAEQFFIVQDGVNRPRILNYLGTNPDACRIATRLADGGGAVNEIPIGTVMAYGHGRISVALRELSGAPIAERFFAVGDIMLPTSPETVLQFIETDYLSGGGAFALPNELGLIHGMEFLKNTATGNGLGSLVILARNGASAFKINSPRGQWQDIDISQVLFTGKNMGTISAKSLININNDIFYRSVDGLRSIGYSIAKSQTGSANPSNNPLSAEVDNELALDSQTYHKFCYVTECRNRIYILSQDTAVMSEHAYDSIISMDSSVLSSYGETSSPAFDGLWTGLRFQAINTARMDGFYEVFINSKTAAGENKLYYLNEGADQYFDKLISSPVSRIYLGAMDLSSQGNNRITGKFEFAELWASDIIGTASFSIYWRPYGHNLWKATSTGTVCFDPTGKPGFIQGMRFAAETDIIGENYEINLNNAKSFEFMIEWTGRAQIDYVVFELSKVDTGINAACDNTGTSCIKITAGEDGEEFDDLSYKVE